MWGWTVCVAGDSCEDGVCGCEGACGGVDGCIVAVDMWVGSGGGVWCVGGEAGVAGTQAEAEMKAFCSCVSEEGRLRVLLGGRPRLATPLGSGDGGGGLCGRDGRRTGQQGAALQHLLQEVPRA